ncbi:MAG: JAB domain-containing protein [Candidatus Altiarchaeota archaeon]|nr:JAB domain-containing protein [Candidatus Altiarchaeota archaeon]
MTYLEGEYENGGIKAIRQQKPRRDSYFDGYEYKGNEVKTNLAIEGRREYRPLKLSNSSDVFGNFRKLHEADKEKFYSVLLDTKNKVIGMDMVSQGSLGSFLVAPREIYKAALLASAASVIFIHSHPSGEPEPSSADIELTRQLKQVGQLIGIQVLDHVIIGRGKF